MTLVRRMRQAAALGALVAVAACSNTQSDRTQLYKSLPQAIFQLGAQAEAPAPLGPEQLRGILAASDQPLMLMEIIDRESRFVVQRIERNGPYVTYGNAARQSATFRDGMIVQTRGLGGDLMSTDEDALLDRLRRRSPGTAPYVMRFLTPENVTRELSFTCLVSTDGEQVRIALGDVSTTGLVMTADCNTPGLRVSSTYVVAPDGYIVSARQWLGDTLGPVASQTLRR